MNSLMRAQRFIAQKATRLATVVVPLAALAAAIPAHANVTFSSGSCSVTGSDPGPFCITLVNSPTGGNPEANQILISEGATKTGGGSVTSSASGSATGSLDPGVIPVSWDFMVSSSGGNSSETFDWSLVFTASGSGTTVVNVNEGATSVADGTEVTGSANIGVPTGGSISSWTESLTIMSSTGYFMSGTELLNAPATAVPEPVSAFLLPVGGMVLLLRRKKKR
jgi:hypothetical protein